MSNCRLKVLKQKVDYVESLFEVNLLNLLIKFPMINGFCLTLLTGLCLHVCTNASQQAGQYNISIVVTALIFFNTAAEGRKRHHSFTFYVQIVLHNVKIVLAFYGLFICFIVFPNRLQVVDYAFRGKATENAGR